MLIALRQCTRGHSTVKTSHQKTQRTSMKKQCPPVHVHAHECGNAAVRQSESQQPLQTDQQSRAVVVGSLYVPLQSANNKRLQCMYA